jgi:O-methyltransferase
MSGDGNLKDNASYEACFVDPQVYLALLKQVITASLYPESSWFIVRSDARKGFFGNLKSVVIRCLAKRDWIIVKKRPFDISARESGIDWPMFGYSMVGHRRLENIELCLTSVVDGMIEGDFVECGVWRGGASIYAKAVLNTLRASDRSVWLADSFEGMPIQTENDKADGALADNSFLAVSLEQVQDNFRRFGLLDEQVKFVKGWFSDSLPASPIEKIAVLRLDGDYYSSTMDALDSLYDRVSSKGYIIIDDYWSFVTCRQAITDFCAKRGITPSIEKIDQHAVYWRKS